MGLILRLVFLNLGLLSPSLLFAQNLQEIAYSKEWLRLLHMEETLTGFKSRADGLGFFLSPSGKTDPHAELLATITEFENPTRKIGDVQLIPRCAFPARAHFLSKFIPLKKTACEEFETWFEALDVGRVHLIFASSYPENPASAFGHTFLRLEKKSGKRRNAFLDYGLNFSAATTGDESGITFAFMGMMGGYPGIYDVMPYYMKIKEYAQLEGRDLYEYQINLTQEEVDQLIRHVWELGVSTHFDYYFLDENCSYQLLTLLEAVKLDWNLSGGFGPYVLPHETVRRLIQTPNAITGIHFRPSLRHQSQIKFEQLSKAQKEIVHDFLSNPDLDQAHKLENDLLVFDTLLSFLQIEKNENRRRYKKDFHESLQVLRSKLPAGSKTNSTYLDASQWNQLSSYARQSAAHFTNPSKSIEFLFGGDSSKENFLQFNLNLGLLDKIDPHRGHLLFNAVDFFQFHFRALQKAQKIQLQEFIFVEMLSLTPWSNLDQDFSWRGSLRYSNSIATHNQPQKGQIQGHLQGGLSLGLGDSLVLTTLLGSSFNHTRLYSEFLSIHPDITLGLLGQLHEKSRLWLALSPEYRFQNPGKFRLHLIKAEAELSVELKNDLILKILFKENYYQDQSFYGQKKSTEGVVGVKKFF